MTAFTFESFVAQDSNREAVRLCRAVAELRTVRPQPIVICGAEGTGKTHLLHAIVNQVSATSREALVFTASASHFPDRVRALLADASPLQREGRALLLVDDLERFTGRVEDLEALVRIFLQHGQNVVLCSRQHPDELRNIPIGLKAMLLKGRTVPVAPVEGGLPADRNQTHTQAGNQPTPRAGQEHGALARVRSWAASRASAKGDAPGQLDAKRRENAALQQEIQRARQKLDEQGRALVAARQEADLARQAARPAPARPQGPSAPTAKDIAATQEVTDLRKQLNALQAENTRLSSEVSKLHAHLQTIEEDDTRARNEVDALVRRADELLAASAREQARANQLDETCRRQVEEIADLRKQRHASAGEAAAARAFAHELQNELAEAAATRDHMKTFLDNSVVEYTAVCNRLDAMQAERDALAAAVEIARDNEQAIQLQLEQARADLASLLSRIRSAPADDALSLLTQLDGGAVVAEIGKMEARIAALAAENTALAEAARRLEAQLQASQEKSRNTQTEVEDLSRRMAAALADLDAERARAAHVEALSEQRGREIEALRERQRRLDTELAVAETFGEGLQCELIEAAATRDDVAKRLDGVAAQRDGALERLAQTQSERETLAIAVAAAWQEQEALQAAASESQADQTALTELVRKLENQLDTVRAVQRERADQFDRQRAESLCEIDALYERQGQLGVELAASEAFADRLQTELTEAISARDAASAHNEAATTERDQASNLLAEVQTERDALAAAVAVARHERETLAAGQRQTDADHAAWVARLQSEWTEAIVARDTAQANLDAVMAQRDEAVDRAGRLRAEYTVLAESVRQLESQLDNFRVAERVISAPIGAEQRDYAQQDEAARERDSHIAAELAGALSLAAQLQADLTEAIGAREEARVNHDALMESVQKLEGEVEAVRIETVQLKEEREALIRQMRVLQTALATEQDRIVRLEREHAASSGRVQTLRDGYDRMAEEARATVHAAEQFRAERDDARDRIERLEAERVEMVVALDLARDAEKSLRAELDGALTALSASVHEEAARARMAGMPFFPAQEKDESTAPKDARVHVLRAAAALNEDLEEARDGDIARCTTGPDGSKRRLGEILRVAGWVTPAQLEDAVQSQDKAARKKLGRILIEKGYASDERVTQALAAQLGLAFVRLEHQDIGPEAVQLLDARLARMHRCMPLRANSDEVTLAMSDPLNLVAIDDVERVTQRHVHVVASPDTDIEQAHTLYYAA